MGEPAEVAKALVNPANKLIESVSSGMGTVYKPRSIKKLAKARAFEIRVIGEALREFCDLPISYEDGKISIDNKEFVQRTQNRLVAQELNRQNNLENIIDQSYEMLECEKEVTDEPVDKDWMSRFLNYAADISNEEMQFVWSKILAGEVKQPGSFSLRTLDVIRSISKTEAAIFQKMVPLIISDDGSLFVSAEESINRKYGLFYGEIMRLDECGLIISNGTVVLNFTIENNDKYRLYNKSLFAIMEGKTKSKVEGSFGLFSLTASGQELYKILEEPSNNEYFNEVIRDISQGNNVRISIYERIKTEDGSISYNKDKLINIYQ